MTNLLTQLLRIGWLLRQRGREPVPRYPPQQQRRLLVLGFVVVALVVVVVIWSVRATGP